MVMQRLYVLRNHIYRFLINITISHYVDHGNFFLHIFSIKKTTAPITNLDVGLL